MVLAAAHTFMDSWHEFTREQTTHNTRMTDRIASLEKREQYVQPVPTLADDKPTANTPPQIPVVDPYITATTIPLQPVCDSNPTWSSDHSFVDRFITAHAYHVFGI